MDTAVGAAAYVTAGAAAYVIGAAAYVMAGAASWCTTTLEAEQLSM